LRWWLNLSFLLRLDKHLRVFRYQLG
jgi:hypothetical protein